MIPRTYRNHLRILGTARIDYDSFGHRELGLVKVNREGRGQKGIKRRRLLRILIGF